MAVAFLAIMLITFLLPQYGQFSSAAEASRRILPGLFYKDAVHYHSGARL